MAKIEPRSILIGEKEHDMLLDLLEKNNLVEHGKLLEELDFATVLVDEDVPDSVVRMHSLVTYKDMETNKKDTVRLVYPGEVGAMPFSVSVLAPIGAALIGLRVGESIIWPLPNRREKKIKVLRVQK